MLVVFGANGRTGIEVVREAVARGIPVRPVVRDDTDGRGLDKVVDLQAICYADADHPTAIPSVLEGATTVISCINARNAGPGSPPYEPMAGANIVRAACARGVEKVVHLSVVGAYRWSPNRLNRESFKIDRNVRLCKELPWLMIRVSCFIDEIVDAHVRPPDGGAPHPFVRSGRYSPISRRDVARLLLDKLPELLPSRTLYVGGPETFRGQDLDALVRPFVQPGGRRRTRYGQLPPGDVSVSVETTRVSMNAVPGDRLVHTLDPSTMPVRPAAEPRPPPTTPPPPTEATVYPTADPGRHPADEGRDLKLFREMGDILRRVVHEQLVADLPRLGITQETVRLDFRGATPRTNERAATAHGGRMVELTGVRVLVPGTGLVHRGPVMFLRDELAEEFRCWWDDGSGLPDTVWRALDLGVRRRLARDPRFALDERVHAFASGHEAAPGS